MSPSWSGRTSLFLALGAVMSGACIAACGKVHETPEPPRASEPRALLDERTPIRVGATVAIADTPLVVTFERIAEDSRCPKNVTCVWEGNAVVRLALRGAGDARGTLDLHTSFQDKREGTFDGFRVRLVELAPWPPDSNKISPDQYVATIVVLRSK